MPNFIEKIEVITKGPQGVAGVGVPVGGTAGQVLSKTDGTDYNTQWVDVASGGGTAAETTYDNAGSGLVATDVQVAIDEVEARVDTLESTPVELATLTKSFVQNEEATLTLSTATTSPSVSVTKEVAQVGVTTNRWSASGILDIQDYSPAADLTINSETSVSLSVGNFQVADEGKAIVANGGIAVLMEAGTGVIQTLQAFDSFTTVPSAEWTLQALVSEGGTLRIAKGSVQNQDIDGLSYDNVKAAGSDTSTQGINAVGNYVLVTGFAQDIIKMYSLSDPNNILSGTTSTTTGTAENVSPTGATIKPDGTKLYVTGSSGAEDEVNEYDLLTPYDITTKSFVQNFDVSAWHGGPSQVIFVNDGATMYVAGGALAVQIFTLGTPWNIGTATRVGEWLPAEGGVRALSFNSDGTKVITTSGGNPATVYQYTTNTPYDLAVAPTYDGVSVVINEGQFVNSIALSSDSTKLYVLMADDFVWQFTAYANNVKTTIGSYHAAITGAGGTIDTNYWTDINSATVTDAILGDSDVFYAYSTDGQTTFKVIKTVDGERSIARNNAGTWEINTNATYGLETWVAAATNGKRAALEEAMQTVTNQMDKAQVNAVGDAEHITLAASLDIAAIFISNDGGTPSYTSLVIDYDANTRNDAAVLGVDYVYDQPAADKIRIQSLKDQNLKIRVS